MSLSKLNLLLLEASKNKRKVDLTVKDEDGETALRMAWVHEMPEIVKALIEAGVEPDTRYAGNWTVLMWASAEGHLALVKELIKAGADVDASSSDREFPLILASWEEHLEIVQVLIRAGADVNAQDGLDKSTALIWASEKGHLGIVKELIDVGADLDLRDRYGKTALKRASEEDQQDIVKALKEAGAKE